VNDRYVRPPIPPRPDGHLIESGQATGMLHGVLADPPARANPTPAAPVTADQVAAATAAPVHLGFRPYLSSASPPEVRELDRIDVRIA